MQPDLQPARAGLVHRTELGNALRLVAAHGADLRYVHPWHRWLVWDGTRWANDDTGEAARRAKGTVQALLAEAAAHTDESEARAIAKHALRSQTARGIGAMLELARSETGIPVVPDQLDANPWLFNTRNVTLHLDTLGRHDRPHDRADLITKASPVNYDPAATCPTWEQALATWFAGDEKLIDWIRRVLGYALAGVTTEQILPILWGPGANGKSTLINTILAVFGDYAVQAPTTTFVSRRTDTIPNDLAGMKGARLVVASETSEDSKLNEALVKQLTGGDPISARFMRSEWFTFTPQFTPILVTNHKPAIRGTDLAVWRRIRLVPFTVTIPEHDRDPNLPDKLQAEHPGILNWLLHGLRAWHVDGITTPAAITAATDGYRLDQDIVGRFLDDCCILHPNARATSSELYARYGYWTTANGEEPLSQKALGQRLADRGLTSAKGTGGTRYWHGITIEGVARGT